VPGPRLGEQALVPGEMVFYLQIQSGGSFEGERGVQRKLV